MINRYIKVKDRDPKNPEHQKMTKQRKRWYLNWRRKHILKLEGNEKWEALGA